MKTFKQHRIQQLDEGIIQDVADALSDKIGKPVKKLLSNKEFKKTVKELYALFKLPGIITILVVFGIEGLILVTTAKISIVGVAHQIKLADYRLQVLEKMKSDKYLAHQYNKLQTHKEREAFLVNMVQEMIAEE